MTITALEWCGLLIAQVGLMLGMLALFIPVPPPPHEETSYTTFGPWEFEIRE